MKKNRLNMGRCISLLFAAVFISIPLYESIAQDAIGGPDKILKESPADLGYTNTEGWLKFPPPQYPEWKFDGVVAGVAVDSKDLVYVSHRGKNAPKLTVWNPDGSFNRIFPGPVPTRPHMVSIDKEDNVWLVDDGGHCIWKMDQEGNVLLTMGEPGVKGYDKFHYNHPTDVGWDQEGNIYITDGDNSDEFDNSLPVNAPKNRRVLKYTPDGKFIKKWGSVGQATGQFDYPHSILVDSKETVFVCDRNNWRLQVFDTEGRQEANWTHIGRVYKIVEDKNGDYFVTDGRVGRVTKIKRDGTIIGFFETPGSGAGDRGSLNNAHSIAICSNGDLITGTYQGWVERWKAPADGLVRPKKQHPIGASLVAPGAEVKKLAGGFKFTEGPVADEKGNIYFSDIPNNRIQLWTTDGKLNTFLEGSGGINGLYLDRHGKLIACQMGDRKLVSIDADAKIRILADSYGDKKLNSPNDLWVDPGGGIYFTDPRYGNRENMVQDGEHVYYLPPGGAKVIRVADDLERPNGVIGTPDGTVLFIADPMGKKTYQYDINPDGSLANKRLFVSQGSDGMAMDEKGNLYLTGKGISIYSPEGELLQRIPVPESPANMCFGGPESRTLYITARTSLYSIETTVRGATTRFGNWTTIDCRGEPDGRHETTFVEVNGKFYMIGGRESQKIDCFDPESLTWTKMKATSPLIHHFQPVVWKNRIYMLGAMTGNYPEEPPMTHIQIYDPKKDKWEKGVEIPEGRRRGGSGTVVYNGKIYTACGITLGHTSGTNAWFDVYDPAKNTWKKLPDAPHIRDHFHAVVLNDKLYCLGGRNSSYHEEGNFGAFFGAVVREIDCFDFRTGKWSTLDVKLPLGSAAPGLAVIEGKILYFGGETATRGPAVNRAWIFDPEKETFTEVAHMNEGRHGSQAISHMGAVYISAGSPTRGGGRTTSTEVFKF